jgi:hypothetical protein
VYRGLVGDTTVCGLLEYDAVNFLKYVQGFRRGQLYCVERYSTLRTREQGPYVTVISCIYPP